MHSLVIVVHNFCSQRQQYVFHFPLFFPPYSLYFNLKLLRRYPREPTVIRILKSKNRINHNNSPLCCLHGSNETASLMASTTATLIKTKSVSENSGKSSPSQMGMTTGVASDLCTPMNSRLTIPCTVWISMALKVWWYCGMCSSCYIFFSPNLSS